MTVTRQDFVERFARVLEDGGESRITGRIYAHLATATSPYLSLQEVADELGVSKASVSTCTRRLIALGLVHKVPVPGARGDHYAVVPDGAARMWEKAVEQARRIAALADEGLLLLKGQVTPGAQGLKALRDVYTRTALLLERDVAPTLRDAR